MMINMRRISTSRASMNHSKIYKKEDRANVMFTGGNYNASGSNKYNKLEKLLNNVATFVEANKVLSAVCAIAGSALVILINNPVYIIHGVKAYWPERKKG